MNGKYSHNRMVMGLILLYKSVIKRRMLQFPGVVDLVAAIALAHMFYMCVCFVDV